MNTQVDEKISNEQEYQQVRIALTEKKKSSFLMRSLMNAMESYRGSKKYGWSRPWNKYDLLNFQSFKLNWDEDSFLLAQMAEVLTSQFAKMPPEVLDYCQELISEKEELMGFMFTHDFTDTEGKYEGITLSLGRVSNKRFRDRLDVILESPIVEGKSQGLKRVRIYVDPYREGIKEPIYQESCDTLQAPCYELFSTLTELSWSWANDEAKLWDHWVLNYVDYFGERQWQVDSSFFPYGGRKSTRLVAEKNMKAYL